MTRSSRFVYFIVTGKSITAANITALLGQQPDDSASAGDTMIRPKYSTVVRTSFWQVYSGLPDERDVEDQLEALLTRCLPILTPLQNNLTELGRSLKIVNSMDRNSGGKGIWISREWLGFLAAVDSDIDIDQYIL
jgi:hypothetical protein